MALFHERQCSLICSMRNLQTAVLQDSKYLQLFDCSDGLGVAIRHYPDEIHT
jgi:hypothetical protein